MSQTASHLNSEILISKLNEMRNFGGPALTSGLSDSVIEGTVVRYHLRKASMSAEQQVDEFQVQIAVTLTFRVKATGETVFEKKQFTGVGNYFLDDGSSNEATARNDAVVEITRDVLAEVVEDW